jgi:Ion channel
MEGPTVEQSLLRRHRYLILGVALVAALILQMGRSAFPYVRESALTLAVALVLLIVFDRRFHRVLALVAGASLVATLWSLRLAGGVPSPTLEIVVHLGAVLFFAGAVAAVLRRLVERRVVRIDDILGTLCGYLLAAIAWANLYSAIELATPGAFALTGPIQSELDSWYGREATFTYFSLSTMTTIGYGDITPVAPAARSASVLQGVFGQFYIAVIVAQLVGSKLAEGQAGDKPR